MSQALVILVLLGDTTSAAREVERGRQLQDWGSGESRSYIIIESGSCETEAAGLIASPEECADAKSSLGLHVNGPTPVSHAN